MRWDDLILPVNSFYNIRVGLRFVGLVVFRVLEQNLIHVRWCVLKTRYLKSSTIHQQLWSFWFFAKFYVIISLWRLPNQCLKKEIMILWKNILIFERAHSNPCVLRTSWPKNRYFAIRQRFRIGIITLFKGVLKNLF